MLRAALLALRDRPQPAAREHADVPRRQQHRAVPDALLHRRAAVPRRPARPTRREIARRARRVLAAVPRRARRRARAPEGASTATRVLWDGHSIKSRAAVAVRRPAARPQPRHRRRRELRAGAARSALARVLRARSATSRHVVDGRFKGGYITRHYGRPAAGRARGAARDVLVAATWTRRRPSCSMPSARRACSRCCARCCSATLRLDAPMALSDAALLWAPRAWLRGGWREHVLLRVGRRRPLGRGHARRRARRRRTRSVLAGPVLPGLVERAQPRLPARLRRPGRAPRRRRATTSGPGATACTASRCASRPSSCDAIAAQLYVELLRGGYTQVCEFHYLQHDRRRQRVCRPAGDVAGRWPMPRPTPASA